MPANESVKAALELIESDKTKVLGVTLGKHAVEPGMYIPRAEAQQAPTLTFAVPDPDKRYFAICMDLDAPFPSLPILGPILHWSQSGFKVEAASSTLTTPAPFVADYIGPAPPPGSSPHRYAFFLFDEPVGFEPKQYAPANGAKLSATKRMFFSLDNWAKQIKLGPAIAANYFTSN